MKIIRIVDGFDWINCVFKINQQYSIVNFWLDLPEFSCKIPQKIIARYEVVAVGG